MNAVTVQLGDIQGILDQFFQPGGLFIGNIEHSRVTCRPLIRLRQ
jgi:hypothetical protein